MQQLNRFIEAQENSYSHALSEIKNGEKRSHWMWYIFPQIKGLGFSSTANFYGIDDVEEAKLYINHDVLGTRLLEITNALLILESNNADEIFGFPDNLKLKSCMTLFKHVSDEPVFQAVLDKFFDGDEDEKTVEILNGA